MYTININKDQAERLEKEFWEDALYVWMGIAQLFWFEEAIMCWILDKEWIDKLKEWEYMKQFKKTKIKRAMENLLCCWILELKDDELLFNKDRYIFMNELWTKIEEEKYLKYKWIWSYEEVKKYEDMIKYVEKFIS